MARESTVDPVRVASVFDVGLHRKKHKRMEVGLRIKYKAEQGHQILKGYLYVARTNISLGKARWFEWPLVGDEPLKQRVEAAIYAIVNETRNLGINEKSVIEDIDDYRCSISKELYKNWFSGSRQSVISFGVGSTCLISHIGELICWGRGKGQLVNGLNKNRNRPANVKGISAAIQISA